jgi:hypothetical protein
MLVAALSAVVLPMLLLALRVLRVIERTALPMPPRNFWALIPMVAAS